MLRLLFALIMSAGLSHAQEITIQSHGGAHSWNVYQGQEKISEAKLFSLAGQPEIAEHASHHSNNRVRKLVNGPVFIACGALLAIRPGQESGNFSTPFVVAGGGVAGVGVFYFIKRFFTPKCYATHESAMQAAQRYNAELNR
ncbi:hypothetical protein KJZ99_04250 [bacterium]|nr:hypothetical protein [bacterium]